MMTDWFRQNRETQELAHQTTQSELRFLKSQINPHFLFNTLNSLYALTLKKSDAAPDIVIKLSEMMRYMLYECNEKQVPLVKEISYIRNYLDLEKLRQQKDVVVDFVVIGDVGQQQIAPLMFMNFLENSFKHGINTGLHAGFVHISLAVEGQKVTFMAENSKGSVIPRSPDVARPSGGIGLANVRRRLELLYPKHYTLDIQESPNSYKVLLTLELID
ncbi:MAG: histidine kinase [Lewinella sp.]|nr:histidine kinase [Lewinella sp.]